MDAYTLIQCKDIIAFDLGLIETLVNLEAACPLCNKILVDLEAIRFDLGVMRDLLSN